MHLEARRQGGVRKYYLAHSFRRGGKVGKMRVFLGDDLGRAELADKKREAEALLLGRVKARAATPDPFKSVLTPEELEEVKALEAKGKLEVIHLSEDDWKRFTESFAYDTNAIEGSAISAREVAEILEKDKWPEKPKNDISETYGVAKAIGFIRKTRERVSIPLMLELHRIVFENSKPFAGKLRKPGVEVVVMNSLGEVVHRGAPSTQLRSLLGELEAWYEKNRRKYPALVLAAVVHNQFENIHPFQDGNGRVGRLLLNNILLKHGLPPVNIEMRNRSRYYAALQAYEKHYNLRPTIDLLLKEYHELKKRLKK